MWWITFVTTMSRALTAVALLRAVIYRYTAGCLPSGHTILREGGRTPFSKVAVATAAKTSVRCEYTNDRLCRAVVAT